MRNNFTILIQRAALERPTFPVNHHSESQRSALDCRVIHGTLWVLRETFLKAYLLEKDHPHLSSKIQRIWHHYLEEEECESRKVRQYRLHVSIRALHPRILTAVLEELILLMV